MKIFILVKLSVLSLILTGCFPTRREMDANHVEARLDRHLIEQSAWSIDRTSFISARSIEVLPFGGDDANSRFNTKRPKADFYPTVEKNSLALMASLFGDEGADQPPGDAPYLLRVQMGRIETTASWNAFKDVQTVISIEFTLVRIRNSQEQVVSSIEITRTVKGPMGTTMSFHINAHKRANRAINEAFVEAQGHLIKELSNSP